MSFYGFSFDQIPFPVLEGDSPALQSIGRWSMELYEEREMLLMYLHLIFSALFPIYTGAHASLRCPPSASEPAKAKTIYQTQSPQEGDDDDLDELQTQTLEGLTPSDAILFPIFAGITLIGLYYLIKWLQDPALLNMILGYYFSFIGIFGVGKLAADALNVLTSLTFPSIRSSGRKVYYIDALLSQQFTIASTTGGNNKASLHRKFTDKTNPLAGASSTIRFPGSVNQALWNMRRLFLNHWIFRCYIHSVINIKAKVRLNDVLGLSFGVMAIIAYNTNGREWWLTNLMGFGFCYGTFQLMSPTTFWTGSLILAGLFIYDIVMVFYTPFMVTVATSLDVPIKLVIPGPNRGGMLGLGDIVLPGIMMALALRFDLYLHYLRKPSPPAVSHSLVPDTNPKPTYQTATGYWGERFWTRSLPKSALPSEIAGAIFPKFYFYASVIGYLAGMITTLVILNVFHHAQPALLYLVPGVLVALWGSALCRGELKLMWNYTEATPKAELVNGKDGEVSKEKSSVQDKDAERKRKEEQDKKDVEKETNEEKAKQIAKEQAHHVFLLSLSSPRQGPKISEQFATK